MAHFVRDHPLYDVEKDLQAMLVEQAGNIRLSTQDNNAAARDIAQRSSPPSGPRQLSPDMLNDFKKASDEQLARLGDAHHEAEQQMVQKLDDMSQMQELIKRFQPVRGAIPDAAGSRPANTGIQSSRRIEPRRSTGLERPRGHRKAGGRHAGLKLQR